MDNWSEEELRKSRSPFSIYFYLKKTNGDELKSRKMLENFLNEKSPFRNKKNRPSSIEYWLNRGYSLEESDQKLKEFQSKPLDINLYIEKYGYELGTIKFHKRKKSMENRKNTEIKNIQETLDCDYNHAYDIFCTRRANSSPRTLRYWVNKGLTEDEAQKKISKFQSEMSPRSVFYWIKKGYSEAESIIKVSSYQDNLSLDAISERYECSKDEAYQIQKEIMIKINNTLVKNEFRVDVASEYAFFVYKKIVDRETRKTLKLNKEFMTSKKKNQSLDHRYSKVKGFINDVPPEIIGSIYNLEFIDKIDNSKKRHQCSITLEELIKEWENGNNN